jgi:NAD(P)-dependent dehydrogenase (short-subunit alcohol dehydrogenase family)
MKSYLGKTVYITGGSSGIGLAAAKQFAAAGANVAIFSRDRKKLDAALPLIEAARAAAGQKFLAVQMDVGNHAEVDTMMAATVRSFGVPDVLVNSAGVAWCNYIEETPYTECERMMMTDFFGVRNTVTALVPFMKERGGNIVNVASILGVVGVYGYSAYCPAKFAVIGFSEVLRAELKPHNIRISILCPPDTNTPQLVEENRTKPPETKAVSGNTGLMQPEQVAAAMIKGMERGKLMIVPGFMNWLTWTMKRLWPGFVFSFMDSDVRKVQAKAGSRGQGSGGSGRNP